LVRFQQKAIESLNKGVNLAGAYHNTGEGGLSPYHCNGGDVVFHFGTGYFGVRDEEGNFSMDKLVELVNDHPYVKAIEVKLSQGGKNQEKAVCYPELKSQKKLPKSVGYRLEKMYYHLPIILLFRMFPN
jgi:Glutamate synthase domain 2